MVSSPPSAELRNHPPLRQDLLELLRTVDRGDQGTVAHEVCIAVRNNDDIAALQGYCAAVLFDAGIGPPIDDQVKDNDVGGTGGEVGGHGARIGFTGTPWRGEFPVEEDRAVEFHGLQDFRQHIHGRGSRPKRFG